jgi:hypothetical protein
VALGGLIPTPTDQLAVVVLEVLDLLLVLQLQRVLRLQLQLAVVAQAPQDSEEEMEQTRYFYLLHPPEVEVVLDMALVIFLQATAARAAAQHTITSSALLEQVYLVKVPMVDLLIIRKAVQEMFLL